MSDNLREIPFTKVEGKDYAGGYTWICPNCKLECFVEEAQFECQDNNFLPVKIVCKYGCGKRWKLIITPDDEPLEKH